MNERANEQANQRADERANERAKFWVARAGGFFLTVLGLCALGGLLGGLVFPVVGRLGGSGKTHAELVVVGVKSGAFIFMVWAPGAALVREFMRGARTRRGPQPPNNANTARTTK